MSHQEHKSHAPPAVRCYVLTVSDTRTAATDASGRAIRDLLEAAGHPVAGSAIVRDDTSDVRAHVQGQLERDGVDAVITTGGTGVSARDSTYEALVGLFDKRLEGFGELFRVLSYQEIGPAAMLSRATAGTFRRKALFILPGSEHAVRLAMTRLIVPELGHVIQQLRK